MYRSFLTASLLTGLAALPGLAHDVQVAKDVGATLHIEPNDTALAGTPTEVWFALTKAGGTVIPLAACDCSLTLYHRDDTALANPNLTPVSAEGFNGIPGATVTFPEVGAYELVLEGEPKDDAQFTPFQLSFEITVAGNASSAASTEISPDPSASESPDHAETTDGAETSTTPPGNSATPTETKVAQTAETPAPPAPSNPWTAVATWGSAVLAVGIVWAIVGGGKSSGGKP